MCFIHTKQAAELGLSEAQHNLGVQYIEKGDVRKGFAWLLQAGQKDFYPSMINLGTIFLYGKGEFAINHFNAYVWLKRAQKYEDSAQLQQLMKVAEKGLQELGIKY